MPNPTFCPLTVFYDGRCPVCRRQMARYSDLDRAGRLRFVDISAPSFDAGSWGLCRTEVMKALHVRDATGRLYRGVEAFRALWRVLPGPVYGRLSRLFGVPGVHGLADVAYRVFARWRHLLR